MTLDLRELARRVGGKVGHVMNYAPHAHAPIGQSVASCPGCRAESAALAALRELAEAQARYLESLPLLDWKATETAGKWTARRLRDQVREPTYDYDGDGGHAD